MESKNLKKIIYVLAVLIPLVVVALLSLPQKFYFGEWVYVLPHVIGIINSITSTLLIGALIAVKRKKYKLHEKLNFTALGMGVVFLVCYVLYHASVESVKYGDFDHSGSLDASELSLISTNRMIYLFMLISHIALSIAVVPLVLFSFFYAWSHDFEAHKRIVRWSYPIWLYVSVSGVLVYLMIRPYY